MTEITYKFKEDILLAEIKKYIDGTYSSHYTGTIQPTELIISNNQGTGFCLGNIIKYASRYGKKAGQNKQDLLKIIHYSIIALSFNH